MSIFYAKNVAELIETSQKRKKIDLIDICSQTYNISRTDAMKIAADYAGELNNKKQEGN